jgi:hypothetical protein
MKGKNALTTVIVAAAILAGAPANAVLQTVVLYGAEGQPLANTTIVISDESGNELGKQDTDDKGALIYDFPERGKKYRLAWDGGSKTVTIPRFSTQTKIGAAAGGAAALTLGALLLGGGDESAAEHTTTTPATKLHPDTMDIPGTYSLTGELTNSTCPDFPSAINNAGIKVSASDSTVTVHSSADVTGPYNSASGAWRGEGTFKSGGYPTIEVYDGTWWNRNSHVEFSGHLTFTRLETKCEWRYAATLGKQ